ncbi:hypothetical protein [Paenibacillus sp. SYP-B4298]|uniref:hypothetical protein n=1 Tax=Paenibacillus sp. SYP-B4298 TaxID=2996034 RepID=UPI0022DE025B|nr:hypothetical protein [Paenibacillus sp. SYP-B4298]
MNVWVTVKSLGKRKPSLAKHPVALPDVPGTLRELIRYMVASQLTSLEERQGEQELLACLMPEDLDAQAAAGRVSFGALYHQELPDLERALETAMTAYEDGLYKVFVDDEDIRELDAPLALNDGAELVFIRFTMLAGRMW